MCSRVTILKCCQVEQVAKRKRGASHEIDEKMKKIRAKQAEIKELDTKKVWMKVAKGGLQSCMDMACLYSHHGC